MQIEKRTCFVVMPYGKNQEEKRWFQGWYEVVIEPSIRNAGFEPFLSAANDEPEAINDEIRRHLALDPMVLVDLGGRHPEDPPNPNVMYELGIRHAFGLPLVLLAWSGQSLPFDISNQRAIMCGREMLDIKNTQEKIRTFIEAAQNGRYYNPMQVVQRQATLENVSSNLEEDSVLRNLIEEIEDLKAKFPHSNYNPNNPLKIEAILPKKRLNLIREKYLAFGASEHLWEEVVNGVIPISLRRSSILWDDESWVTYLTEKAALLLQEKEPYISVTGCGGKDPSVFPQGEEFKNAIVDLLPEQPWPKNIHKLIAAKLSVSNRKVTAAINELVKEGRFMPQIDGVVYKPESG